VTIQCLLRRAGGWWGAPIALLVLCTGSAALAAPAPVDPRARVREPIVDSPYDTRQRALARSAAQKGRAPEAALDLLRMSRFADEADPELTLKLFDGIAKNRALDVQHRIYAARRSAWDLRRKGDVRGSIEAFRKLGYLSKFRVVGPFDNEGKRGFDTAFGPELERADEPNPSASYQGRERPVRFRPMPEIVQGGYVSFDAVLRPAENVCGVAETNITLARAEPLTLWLGGGGAIKLYFNGTEVLRDEAYRTPSPDRSVVLVQGKQGKNRLLVKACVTSGTFGFYLRVADARGEPRPADEDPSQIAKLADEPAAPTSGKAKPGPRSVLEQLEEKAAAKPPRADALENLARYLWFTGADDPAEHRARQLAQRAAELAPTVQRLVLASALSAERYERMNFARKALALDPKDPAAQLLHGELTGSGPASERALALYQAIPRQGTHGMDGLDHYVTQLSRLGLNDSALAAAREGLAKAPRSAAWLARLADLLSNNTQRDEQIELERRLLALRFDHAGARRVLIDDAIAQRRDVEVLEHLEALRTLYPGEEKRALYIADAYDALGRDDLALATLKTAIDTAPESADLHVRYGRALLRGGQSDAAAQSFRLALTLRPQDAETRELLEQLAPEERLDESYAAARDVLLARRVTKADHPFSVLQDLAVNTVYDNGLGSRFVQFAAQVHDQEGARRLRARSIQFDPETQRVDVRLARVYRADGSVLEATESYEEQLGEPWYRVYYDTRALVVVFPSLLPGDSIELRYRVDDVASRNLFADYYGDLHMLAGFEPHAHVEYVLITPTSRTFYFSKPKFKLEHTQRVDGARRIDRFVAENVAALRAEPAMPGLTEALPYLHVSTYKSWSDVARWWWGLVHDQLYADDHLKRIVAELKQGAKDERELVERVYGWVIENTRYVALEFGIHGFLPYRVPEVVRRGFGDCKDKASLIYTMLREAGVDARLVLVRTRRNGGIDEMPASLAVFDHAIAYVPGLDLYLDGTAEHSGSRELPAGDQGVMVLLVGPSSAELRKTPVLPADSNVRARKTEVELLPDGSGTVSVEERITGVQAASYRSTFEAPGTQRDRLTRQLSGTYPGLSLEDFKFDGLTTPEKEVTLRYKLKAPVLARVEGGELRAAPTGLNDLLREYAGSATRKYPVELGVPSTYHEERNLRPPPRSKLRHVPDGGEVKSRFGSLSVQLSRRDDSVLSKVSLTLSVDRVEPHDYPEFRRFIQQADELLRQRVAFVPESR
jgi:Flp pilus assembly protein TadD